MRVDELMTCFSTADFDSYVAPIPRANIACYEVGREHFQIITPGKVGGFDLSDFSNISMLYDLIPENDRDLVMDYSYQSMRYVNSLQKIELIASQSKVIQKIKGKNNKTYYYLRHGFANGVRNGQLVTNFTYLEDVTWMQPKSGTWQLLGPEANYFDFNIPEIASFKGVLSTSEIRVLKLVARGFHSRDIAEGLRLSRHTVDTHRRNMLRKMDAANTPELLTLARDMNLIS